MCGLVSERKHAPKSNGKNTAHKARGRESAENAEAVQRAFPRPPAPFFVFLRKGSVLVCGERSEPHLYQDKHTPNRQDRKNI